MGDGWATGKSVSRGKGSVVGRESSVRLLVGSWRVVVVKKSGRGVGCGVGLQRSRVVCCGGAGCSRMPSWFAALRNKLSKEGEWRA